MKQQLGYNKLNEAQSRALEDSWILSQHKMQNFLGLEHNALQSDANTS